ncbi:MAG: hypothetical protein M3Q16_05105 [Pseudomonadota bacterium]|nr:hypothetical protein [Pseudomonadota bacterium]
MTRFFITRPIFASVVSIIIVLAGLAAAMQLPIAQGEFNRSSQHLE